MKMNNNVNWLRNLAAFCLMVTVFVSTSMVALAKPGSSLAGEIIVSGSNTGNESLVMLNGERAFSGRTFFESGVVSTSETTSATIKLGKLGYITLAPNSSMSVSFTENTISGKVLSGDVKVFNNAGVTVNVENLPARQTKDDDDDDDNSILVPLLIFAAAVGTAVVFVVTNDNDNGSVVSTVR
jgi:hypothetical protein